MSLNRPLPDRLDSTWKYGLLGGLGSIPLTLVAYWQSGMGDEFTLSAVFLGAVLAGYLAGTDASARVDATTAGLRAGLVGGLPAFAWFLREIVGAASALAGPTWFLVAATVLTATAVGVVLAFAGLVGLVGGAVGDWLAGKVDRPRTPPAGS